MRKLRKKYKNPKKAWDSEEIKKNKETLSHYGLRRKREILRAQDILRNFRRRARNLIATTNDEEKTVLVEKMKKMGLLQKGGDLDDILALTVNDILERRLQTIVFKKGFAKTIKHARQMIVHGLIEINGKRIKYPSYIVAVKDEDSIKLIEKTKNPKVEKAKEKPKNEDKSIETQKANEETPGEEKKEEANDGKE